MAKNRVNEEEMFARVMDIAVPDTRMMKTLKPWQRQELMAMYQWMQENNPDFQNPMEVLRQNSPKPRFVSKQRHRKKAPKMNREHY